MFLIIQNDPQCPPGSCADSLASAGQDYRTLAAYRDEPLPSPESLTGAIILGGEMGVHDTANFPYLRRVHSFIANALRAGTPLLGICLGGQLISHAAGGTVSSPSSHGEKGVCRVHLNDDGAADPLFTGVPTDFVTFQLHNDSFTVPPGATLLADSPVCPAQAFRLGRNCYGLQFHPEVDRGIVTSWGALSSPPSDFLSGFLSREDAFVTASRTILRNFIALAA